jgi:hypothetical protein
VLPEGGNQSSLAAFVRATVLAPEQNQAAVTLTGPENLARMPRKGGSVEGDEHEARLCTGDEQGGIIQPQPRSAPPGCDVNDWKTLDQSPAGRDEPMRGVLVSQQLVMDRLLLRAID